MDQRRLFLAVILSMTVLLVYYAWLGKRVEKTRQYSEPATREAATGTSERKTPSFIPAQEGGKVRWAAVDEDTKLFSMDTDFLELTFSSRTGDIKSIGIKGHAKEVNGDTEVLTNRVGDPIGTFTLLAPFGEEREWTGFERTGGEGWTSFRGKRGDIQVTKRYDYHRSSHLVWATFLFENMGPVQTPLEYETTFSVDHDPSNRYDSRFIQAAWLDGKGKVRRKGLKDFTKGHETSGEELSWSGIRTKYFCLLAKPFVPIQKQAMWSLGPKNLVLSLQPVPTLMAPGQRVEHRYLLYAGPQDLDVLGRAGHDFAKAVDLGFFGGISVLILAVLRFFYRIFGNWGVAIILLAVAIKLLLHPLTEKSFRSMKELQNLQPEMNRMKEKYKGDHEKMNKAMAAFYKEHKVNPLGGCFPILLQMPVFFALYNALIRANELRGARFILWIKDLSQPDKFITMPWNLPIIGSSVHLLPILMGIATIFQQRLTTSQGGPQSEQQMVMSFMMPVLLILIFYHLPSGLVLYWTTNTILTVFHQYQIVRVKPKPAA